VLVQQRSCIDEKRKIFGGAEKKEGEKTREPAEKGGKGRVPLREVRLLKRGKAHPTSGERIWSER